MALTDKLTAIGDAIREKTGSTDLMTLDEMPNVIAAITTSDEEAIPQEAFNLTGGCSYKFATNSWNWFIEKYGNQITTTNLTDATNMFNASSFLKEIPFDLNFKEGAVGGIGACFNGCRELEICGDINNLKFNTSTTNVFAYCDKLRYLPKFNNCDFSVLHTTSYASCGGFFMDCKSLRSIDKDLLSNLHTPSTSGYGTNFYNEFYGCCVLDEIIGLPVPLVTYTSNVFNTTFGNCYRVSRITFEKQEDGTPYVANWKGQVIDLSYATGFQSTYSFEHQDWSNASTSYFTSYNSGITKDKFVYNDELYEQLKNDPDWFTMPYNYSRYNKISAIETIDSLPDCSGSGGTNTIKFKGLAGDRTDGGAINTMTDAEIAVAAAKGWTVSFT